MKNIFLGQYKIDNAVQKDDNLEIEGFICHFGKANLNQEIVDSKSFDTFFNMMENKQIKPKLNYNHTDSLIGGIHDIISVDEGLYMSAYLNNNIALVRDMIAPSILAGELDSFSTEGYIQNGYDGIVENEDGSYYVKDFLLTAVAIVPTPADPNATFTLRNFIAEYKLQKRAEQEKLQKDSKIIFFI